MLNLEGQLERVGQEKSKKGRAETFALCWAIWKAHNAMVWEKKNMSASEVISLATTTLTQWTAAQENAEVESTRHAEEEDEADKWKPPYEWCIKVNVDAALFQ